MKNVIFFSLFLMMFSCTNTGEQTTWVKQTNSEQNKLKQARNDCKLLAQQRVGEPPIVQAVPRCSRKYDPSCSFTQGQVIEKNEQAQQDWQHIIDSAMQNCMGEKGYEEESF